MLFHAIRGGGGWALSLQAERPTRSSTRERSTQALNVGFSIDRTHRHVAQALSRARQHGRDRGLSTASTAQQQVVTSFNARLFASAPLATWEKFRRRARRSRRSTPGCCSARLRPDEAISGRARRPRRAAWISTATPSTRSAVPRRRTASWSSTRTRAARHVGRDSPGRCARWGGEDYLDLLAVVDEVAERPYADAERIGIYGYSYGGYMTAWMIGQTNRFKAAVCGAPCFDLASFCGTSDIAVSSARGSGAASRTSARSRSRRIRRRRSRTAPRRRR